MEKILIDENGDYGLEYANAVWASGQMHQDYHDSKVPLSDADFVLEDEASIMVIEYKNANTKKRKIQALKRHHLILWMIRNLRQSFVNFMILFIICICWGNISP